MHKAYLYSSPIVSNFAHAQLNQIIVDYYVLALINSIYKHLVHLRILVHGWSIYLQMQSKEQTKRLVEALRWVNSLHNEIWNINIVDVLLRNPYLNIPSNTSTLPKLRSKHKSSTFKRKEEKKGENNLRFVSDVLWGTRELKKRQHFSFVTDVLWGTRAVVTIKKREEY